MRSFYIDSQAPAGGDGTENSPWQSFVQARDDIRQWRAGNGSTDSVHVSVLNGEYALDAPLVLEQQDSNIIFSGQSQDGVIVHGAKKITQWEAVTVNGVAALKATLPELINKEFAPRQLFVQGERRPRARYPKFELTPEGIKKLFTIAEYRGTPGLLEGDWTFKPADGDVKDWASLRHAEAVIQHYWVSERLPDLWLNPDTGWIESSKRTGLDMSEAFGGVGARYFIDNLFEALTEPGEWYCKQTTGEIFVIPKEGETPDSLEAYVSWLPELVVVRGDVYGRGKEYQNPTGTRAITGVHFTGMTFAYSDWMMPRAEPLMHDDLATSDRPYCGSVQAAMTVDGAIRFEAAEHCSIKECTVAHVGTYAIALNGGSKYNTIERNTLHDVGAGGVKIHGSELDGPVWQHCGQNTVIDNHIHAIGRVFPCGIGVIIGHGYDNTVAHNHIHDTYYSAISVGWSWGYKETVSRNNRIEYNHLHDIGQGLLSDLGAVYTLGVQPGTVVRGNHIHGLHLYHYGGWGIYLDEGSSHITVEDNFVYDVQGPCFNMHFGRECLIRNNVFLGGNNGVVSIGKSEEHVGATISHNILVSPNGRIYEGGYGGAPHEAFRADNNIIHVTDGSDKTVCAKAGSEDRLDWQGWLGHHNDANSADTDPQVNATTGTAGASETLSQLGIRPVDVSRAGIRPLEQDND